MNKNSLGIKIKRLLAKNNRLKSIFTIVVLLLVLLISKINTRPTNTLADRIKTTINYEYQMKEDSVKIYHKAKEVFNSTVESIPVFNAREKLPPPVSGIVHRGFDAQVETPDGLVANGGKEDVIGEVGVNKDGNKYLRLELYIDDKLVDPEKHIEF